MTDVLNSYLLLHKSINIPGLGTIYIERLPARTDFVNKHVLPPSFRFRFDKYFDSPDKQFFAYLANQKNMQDYEAIKWYNEFAYDLRAKIRTEDKAEWDGIGVFKKDISGEIIFEEKDNILEQVLFPAKAEKVIQKKQPLTLTVGNKEVTSYDMSELLLPDEPKKKISWWVYAAIIAALAAGLATYHFYKHGFNLPALGNQQAVSVQQVQ